ncbi:MAG: Spo0B domain-containing protein [Bacilli bacterium]
MDNERELILCLRHLRHDWVNRLQLIKSYSALGQFDKLDEVIGSVVYEIEQESKLTRMGLERFLLFIHRHSWRRTSLEMDYEIIGTVPYLQEEEPVIIAWLEGFLTLLLEHLDDTESNSLHMSFETDDATYLYGDFSGKFKNVEAWKHSLEKYIATSQLTVTLQNLEETTFTVAILLKT